MRVLLSEVFGEFKSAKTKTDKKKLFEKYKNNKAFLQVLQFTYSPIIEFLLPPGAPPYTESDLPENMNNDELNERTLSRDLRIFIRGAGYDNFPAVKREMKFVDLLENVHKDEAKLLVAMKDKDLSEYGITEKLVKEYYPGLVESKNLVV